MTSLAPIVLFVYNRPWHAEQTLNALMKNELAAKSVLYIYADGPKENASKKDLDKIKETRKILTKNKWCKEVFIIENEKNKGLADSIISGVTQVINNHGNIIVLEDDIIVSPYFLDYMNDGLSIFNNEEKVISINAFNYRIETDNLPETYFIKGADCQGWATWLRGWHLFEHDANKLLKEITDKKLEFEFDIQGTYPYTQMLKDQVENHVDSWAIRWYASAFLKNKYTLYPGVSLIYNTGFDNSGTHTGAVDNFNNKNWNNKRRVNIKPAGNIETNKLALERWRKYLDDLNKPSNKKKDWFSLDPHYLLKRIYNRFKGQIPSKNNVTNL